MELELEIAILIFTIIIIVIAWSCQSKKPSLPQQLSLRKYQISSNQVNQYKSAKHKFENFDRTGLYYCNICAKLMGGLCQKQILECKVCGILVHQFCRYKRKPDCKYLCLNENEMPTQINHQWIDGNLPINSICAHCELICMSYYSLEGSSCLWCQKVVHDECRDKYSRVCDQGFLFKHILCAQEIVYIAPEQKSLMIPLNPLKQFKKSQSVETETQEVISEAVPRNQKLILGQAKLTLKFQLSQKKYPIVVLINKNSGGQSGSDFLNSFYRYLNPLQVISIIDDGLERLKVFSKLRDIKIIVAGGDGTVGSVINYIKSGEIEEWKDYHPPVAILPLGTGNDLSRALGWGGCYENLDGFDVIQSVASINNVILLDRWKVMISQPESNQKPDSRIKKMFKVKQETKNQEMVMFNYFGIGLDAKFCLGFHNLRQKNPRLFKSRIGNKFIYTKIGLDDLLLGLKTRLGKMVKLYCDGQLVDVPETIENLVVLNINCWAGGASNVWNVQHQEQDSFNLDESRKSHSKFKPLRMSDGILEVIGISSILHLGRVQVGIAEPIMICQGKQIKIIIEEKTTQAIQVDGEPQEVQTPICVEFKLIDKVQMLSKTQTIMHNWEHKVLEAMTWAQQQSLITPQAKQQILDRMLE